MERNRQFVERLAARLALETNLFTDVFYKGDLKSLGPKALLFVPEEDLVEHAQPAGPMTVRSSRNSRAATNLDSLFNLINQQIRTAKREENAENNALIKAIPALQRIVVQANADSSRRRGRPFRRESRALFGAGQDVEEVDRASVHHFRRRPHLSGDGAGQRSEDLSAKAVRRMRQLMDETNFEVPGLNVGLTGEPVLDYDEMEQSKRDATLAVLVSLVVSSLIFITPTARPGVRSRRCFVW